MPEVPELNIVGITLQKHFKGQKFKSIDVLWKKRVKASNEEFNDAFKGATLQYVDRNGKELHLHFDNGNVLGIHMMLTGKMVLLPTDENLKNPIFELLFENGAGIIVLDGMGQAKPILNPEVPNVPDILSDDFTLEYFAKYLSKASGKIKEVIQKQDKIRGIGSAYADEILWCAKISPYSIAKNIPADKVKELHNAIKTVTVEATEELEKLKTSDDVFEMENKDHRFVHNPKRKTSPEGEEIIVGKLGSGKTYYTESQKLYYENHTESHMFGRDENEIRQFLRQALNDERWIIVGMTAANNVRAIDPDIYIEREVRIITFEPENDTFNGRIRIPFTNPDGRKYTVEQEWSARLDTIHYVKSILPE